MTSREVNTRPRRPLDDLVDVVKEYRGVVRDGRTLHRISDKYGIKVDAEPVRQAQKAVAGMVVDTIVIVKSTADPTIILGVLGL